MDLQTFADVAPYLTHPLTLAGFVLLLVFGVHRALIKSGILPRIDRTAAPGIVKMLLSYGFVIGILIIVAGFGLQAYQSYLDGQASVPPRTIHQETYGDGSPAVADTNGDVTITIEGQPPPSRETSQ
jgi:hypothetical protein